LEEERRRRTSAIHAKDQEGMRRQDAEKQAELLRRKSMDAEEFLAVSRLQWQEDIKSSQEEKSELAQAKRDREIKLEQNEEALRMAQQSLSELKDHTEEAESAFEREKQHLEKRTHEYQGRLEQLCGELQAERQKGLQQEEHILTLRRQSSTHESDLSHARQQTQKEKESSELINQEVKELQRRIRDEENKFESKKTAYENEMRRSEMREKELEETRYHAEAPTAAARTFFSFFLSRF